MKSLKEKEPQNVFVIIGNDIKAIVKHFIPFFYIMIACGIMLLGLYFLGVLIKWLFGVTDATLIAGTYIISIFLFSILLIFAVIYTIVRYIKSIRKRLDKTLKGG